MKSYSTNITVVSGEMAFVAGNLGVGLWVRKFRWVKVQLECVQQVPIVACNDDVAH